MRLHRQRLIGCVSLATLSVVFLSTPAAAQVQATPTDEASSPTDADIIVTARRRDERLQDVPQVITVASGEELQQRGVVSTSDLQFVTPGLTIVPSPRSQSTPVFTIRGMSQNDNSLTVDPSVGIYFAEVPIARPNGLNGGLFDMASVQTLKGPQGTLFGRNTVGGAILFSPNAPEADFNGLIQATAGSYAWRDLEGMLNVPLTDGVALRVSGKFTRRDGYMVNKSAEDFNSRSNDISGESLRAYLRIEPTSNIVSDTIGTWYHSRDHGTGYKLVRANPALFPVPALRPAFAAAAAEALALGKYEFIVGQFTNADGSKQKNFSRTDVKSIQNTTTFNLSDNLVLKNIVGYRHTEQDAIFDLGGMSVLTVRTNAFFDVDQVSEELQLQGTGPELNWIVGGFYFQEKGIDGAPSNQFSTRTTINGVARAKNSNRSAFAHFDYSPAFAPGLTLAAGLRYNHDKRTTSVKPRRPTTVNGQTGYICGLDGVVIVPSPDGQACKEFTNSATFSKVTYDATLSYKLTPDVMAYVSHRKGYRSGSIFGRPVTLAQFNKPTNPEELTDIEVGLKSSFEAAGLRGKFNVAYYHANLKDAQRTVSAVDSNGVVGSTYVNAAGAKMDGVDVDASLSLSQRLTLGVSYAYINARYTNFIDLTSKGLPVDVSDSGFAYTPKHVVTANARYLVPIAESMGDLALQASYYHQTSFDTNAINTTNCGPGGTYTTCANSLGSRLPGYDIVNLRVDWERFMNSGVDLAIFVNNVTNKFYYTGGNAQIAFFGVDTVTVGTPRIAGVQMRLRF